MSRVMMWANYRRGPSISVPSPYDGDPTVPWWYDKVASMAQSWALAGITDVLLPNPIKTNAGAFPGADGYGPFDDYDIGSKNTMQFGGTATRFGIAEQLRRAVAVCHANGLNVLIDHVMHQRQGGRNGVYAYLGADGKTTNGRFAKTPSCFLGDPPRVPRDPIPDVPDDFGFGDELCPVNAQPPRYVRDGLIAAGNWLFTTLDADGARMDDMKGINSPFIETFVTSGAMNGKWFFGEYASGNSNDLYWWVDQVQQTCSASDFSFHYNMAQDMCNQAGGGSFQMSWLANRGMIAGMPMKAVPFVESMDSDTNGFAAIVDNKILGYALMLGGEGLPMIYVRDYLPEPDCYGLKSNIDNLVWIARHLASGNTINRYGDAKTFIFERDAAPGLVVALNNSVWDPAWKYVNVQTNFGSNVQLHDYTGHCANDCWTDNFGRVTLAIPPGANGLGYSMWSRAGQDRANIVSPRATTQVFYGAVDLDTPPANNGLVCVARIWVAKHSPLHVTLTPDTTGWAATSGVGWRITGPDDAVVGDVVPPGFTAADTATASPAITVPLTATTEGWHRLYTLGHDLPATGSGFALSVTYTAPQHFTLPIVPHNAQRSTPDPALAADIAAMADHVASLRRQRAMRRAGVA